MRVSTVARVAAVNIQTRATRDAGARASMITQYVLVKFFHILIAILALGTSAGLGIVLEFYGGHPTHGPFLLRAIGRIVAPRMAALQ